jgi:hypothetical protein
MKRLIVAMTMAVGLGVIGMAHSAGIAGSAHDFTDNIKGTQGGVGGVAFDESWNGRKEICRVCHVPHDHGRVAQNYQNGLLWNHAVSSATYTMYDKNWSSTISGTQSAQPDGTAKLCLGCHDGTVAIDTFDKYAGGAIKFDDVSYDSGYNMASFTEGATQDLRGTHPISIEIPAGEAGDGKNFNDPTVAAWFSGDTVASTLNNNKVQCSTCHDVHNQESVPNTHLLRAAQTVAQGGTASGLCLTCHIK